jgi:cyclophilin family peptidyl-prolyl cis-trans isomerase
MKVFGLISCLVLASGSQALFGQLAGTNPLVRFHTDLGDMDVVLLQDVAPNNVANFLAYVTQAIYDNSFIHRSPPNFVIQGGGFKFANGQVMNLPQGPPVVNEFHVSNTRGTLAMAKLPNNPNSATNQWFFNESNANAVPPISLDTQNGGFTVFGRIINSAGLTTMDTIAALPIYDLDGSSGNTFDQVPLIDYHSGDAINNSKLVNVIWIKVVPQIGALSRLNPTTVRVQGRGAANTTYRLDMSSSSAAGSGFTTSVNVTTSAAGDFTFDDTSAGTKKFYRAAIP